MLLKQIPLGVIIDSETNTRKDWGDLKGLSLSLKECGVIQPLLVRQSGNYFQVICGARRYRAARLAGMSSMPCIVKSLDEAQALQAQITENAQRADIHPLDEAEAIQMLMRIGSLSAEQAGSRIGKSPQYVWRRLTFLRLLPELQDAWRKREMGATAAENIARLPEDEQRGWIGKVKLYRIDEVREQSRLSRVAKGEPRAMTRQTQNPPAVKRLKMLLGFELPPEAIHAIESCVKKLESLGVGIKPDEAKAA